MLQHDMVHSRSILAEVSVQASVDQVLLCKELYQCLNQMLLAGWPTSRTASCDADKPARAGPENDAVLDLPASCCAARHACCHGLVCASLQLSLAVFQPLPFWTALHSDRVSLAYAC